MRLPRHVRRESVGEIVVHKAPTNGYLLAGRHRAGVTVLDVASDA
jgi:hypothetical protein